MTEKTKAALRPVIGELRLGQTQRRVYILHMRHSPTHCKSLHWTSEIAFLILLFLPHSASYRSTRSNQTMTPPHVASEHNVYVPDVRVQIQRHEQHGQAIRTGRLPCTTNPSRSAAVRDRTMYNFAQYLDKACDAIRMKHRRTLR
jgi:hypothetical protein